jgi:uncharacterized protein YutE (UPF0331/DUF86 family)
MVLRSDAIRERLLKLEEVISRLEDVGPLGAATLRLNFRDAWIAERGLQLGAEAIFDIGNHILSAHFGVSPKDYEDIMGQLAAQRVIDEALRLRLKGLGGFRNVLVHDYLIIELRSTRQSPLSVASFAIFARKHTSRSTLPAI